MVANSWMEILTPTSVCFPNSSWILGEKKSGNWTQQENKIFENALAHIDSRCPRRWEMVAAMIPGKSVREVITHYQDLEDDVNHIEAGLIPCPGYSSSSFMLDWESYCSDEARQSFFIGGKRSAGGRMLDQGRKKGVPWTEEEHKQFLRGLQKHGKGDWRNISRNFVVTRTPTQVASHAQKYFNRLNSGGKDKRRASIHDITTDNLQANSPSSPPSQPSVLGMQSSTTVAPRRPDQFSSADSIRANESSASVYSSSIYGNRMIQLPYGSELYGIKLEPQDSFRGGLHHGPMVGHHAMII